MATGLALFDRDRAQIEAAFEWLDGCGSRGEEAHPAPSQNLLTSASTEAAARQLIALLDAVANVSALRFHPRQRIAWVEARLHAARRVQDRAAEGYALGNLGNAHADLGEARQAIGFYEQRLVIAREIGDRRGESNALWSSALAYESLGQRAEALPWAQDALRLYEAIESPHAAKVRAWLAERA